MSHSLQVVAHVGDSVRPFTDADLLKLAAFLAEDELQFNVDLAQAYGPAWYQEQVGADLCSLAQAATLRRMTIANCEAWQAGNAQEPSLAHWNRETPKLTLASLCAGMPRVETPALPPALTFAQFQRRFWIVNFVLLAFGFLYLLW